MLCYICHYFCYLWKLPSLSLFSLSIAVIIFVFFEKLHSLSLKIAVIIFVIFNKCRDYLFYLWQMQWLSLLSLINHNNHRNLFALSTRVTSVTSWTIAVLVTMPGFFVYMRIFFFIFIFLLTMPGDHSRLVW